MVLIPTFLEAFLENYELKNRRIWHLIPSVPFGYFQTDTALCGKNCCSNSKAPPASVEH